MKINFFKIQTNNLKEQQIHTAVLAIKLGKFYPAEHEPFTVGIKRSVLRKLTVIEIIKELNFSPMFTLYPLFF
jgi:hypothetical protein